jgi:hypothetical protein
MKKIYSRLFFIAFFSFFFSHSFAQVSTNGASGLAASYGSLTAAINDLNLLGTVTANVVITLEGNETAPPAGYRVTATGTPAFSIVIDGSGYTITAGLQAAGSTNDAVFKIVGGDYITLENFIINENASNNVLTLATNTMTEFGIALYAATTTDGAKNNTIRENEIALNAAYRQSMGILSTSAFSSSTTIGGAAPGAQTSITGGENSDNKYYGNTISTSSYGILLVAPPATATFNETGNDIGGFDIFTGNSISFGNNLGIEVNYPSAFPTTAPERWGGITVINSVSVNVGFNTISSAITYTTNGNNGVALGWTGTAPVGFDFVNIVNGNTITLNTSTVVAGASSYGIDFGYGLNAGGFSGLLGADANNITINQTTAAANTAAVIAGIRANYNTNTIALTANIISINQTNVSTFTVQSSLTGIQAGAASMSIPTSIISGNSITFTQVHQGTGLLAITSPVNGIAAAGALSTVVDADISSNNVTVLQSTTSTGTFGAGVMNFINVAGGNPTNQASFSSTLTINSNNLNTLGGTILYSGVVTGINHDFTNVNTLSIATNTIDIDRTGVGNVFGTYASATAAYIATGAVSSTVSGNNISLTGTMSPGPNAIAINEQEGRVAMVKNITGNTINISLPNTTSGTHVGIVFQTGATGQTLGTAIGSISNSTITIATGGQSVYGVQVTGTTTVGVVTNIHGNNFNLASNGNNNTLAIKGVFIQAGTRSNIYSNNFVSLAATGISSSTTPSIRMIELAAGAVAANRHQVYSNIISNIFTFAGTGSATVEGIYSQAPCDIYKNKIYGLSANTSGANTRVNGIQVTGFTGTTIGIYNNIIGFDNSACPNVSNTDVVRGIFLSGPAPTSTINVTHNTIYINAVASGSVANFGTTGLYHTASATVTSSSLVLRNNIIVNNSVPKGTGYTVAFRRSSAVAGTLANYSTSSNNNLFYAGPSTGFYSIYYDGTNLARTLAQFKTFGFNPPGGTFSPRESNSVTENPNFTSTLGSDAGFLHINTLIGTLIESGGITGTGITDDYDTPTDIRCPDASCPGVTPGAPDIGADEFLGICIAPTVLPTAYTVNAYGVPTPGAYTGSFTAASPAPTGGYLIVRTPTNAQPVPVSGTTYIVGNTIGAGTVVGVGAGTSFVDGSVGAGTYYYWLFAYNACSGSPSYSATALVFSTVACVAPTAQPTALLVAPASTSSITGSFTPVPLGGASGYLVVRTPTNVAPSPAPFNGTAYVAGAGLGGGIVVSSGTATTFTATGLAPNTPYWFWVYAYNDLCTAPLPVYNTTAPLTGTATTFPCAQPLPAINTVGVSGTFPTITAAIANLVSCSALPAGNYVFELQNDYVSTGETYPITFPATITGAHTSIIFRPSATATGLNISSNNTVGTLLFQGVSRISFDGRQAGTGSSQLTIQNTNIGSSYAVQFQSGASTDTIRFCNIRSAHNGTSGGGGTINFAQAGAAANTNIVIENNNIFEATGGTPTVAIYSNGTSVALPNSGITIQNNNIYNHFNAAYTTAGIHLAANSLNWTISGNSFYQTANRTFTSTGAVYNAILSAATSNTGISIADNFIGGTSSNAGGTALTILGNGILRTIQLTTGTSTASSVQNNTIRNIAFTSSNPALNSLITLQAGTINTGTVTGNTIGNTTGTGSITATLSDNTSGVGLAGISSASTVAGDLFAISNNNIGSITLGGTSTAAVLRGINISGATGASTILANTIGSLTTANSLSNNLNTTVTGIYGNSSNAGGTQIIANNTIVNIAAANAGTSSYAQGIYIGNTGVYTVGNIANGGNQVYNIVSAGTNTVNYNATGIACFATSAGQSIQGNTIYNLSASSASTDVGVIGIYHSGPASGTNIVERNFIHSLNLSSTNVSSVITGIQAQSGNGVFKNNMIRLGITATGTSITRAYGMYGITENAGTNSIWMNSVYLGGSGVTAGSDSYAFYGATPAAKDIRNNIFWNARSNASASTPNHYAIVLVNNAGTTDYNDLVATGTGRVLGFFGAAQYLTLSTWQTASSEDANSFSSLPGFVNPTAATPDLHINPLLNSVAEASGILIGSVTNDIDNDDRTNPALTPTDLGADAFTATTPSAKVDVGITALVAPAAGFGCYGAAQPVTITLRNYSASLINFATTPINVSVVVSGPVNTTIPITINSGTLAAGASANFTAAGTLNMSAFGTYDFVCTFTVGNAGVDEDFTNDQFLTNRSSASLTIGSASSAPASFCGLTSGTPTISLNSVSGGAIQWYQATVNGPLPGGTWSAVGTNSISYTPGSPISATHYYAAGVTCGGSTIYSNIVTVLVSNPLVLAAAVSGPSSSCGPASFTFTGSVSAGSDLRWYDAANGGALVGSGSPFVSPVVNRTTTYYARAESSSGVIDYETFGTGAGFNVETGYPAPYTNWYGGTKHQMLILASELAGAGITAGQINSVAFNIKGVGTTFSGALTDFQINLGSTSSTALTNTFEAVDATPVYGPVASQAIPSSGWVTHNFTTPFTWNGVDNIVVQTSYSNNNTGGFQDYVQTFYTPTSFNSTTIYRADDVSSAVVLAAGSANSFYSPSTNRPDMIIGYTAVCSSTSGGSPVTVTVNPVPSPIVISPASASICLGRAGQDSVLLSATGGTVQPTGFVTASNNSTLVVPDFNSDAGHTGVSNTVTIAGIPAGATIDSARVRFSASYGWNADLLVNLESPNGKIVNLVSNRGGSSVNFTNTIISSVNTNASLGTGTAPFSGLFRADGANLCCASSAGTGFMQVSPVPFPNTTVFSDLWTAPAILGNGTWRLRAYDDEAIISGSISNWTLTIYYKEAALPSTYLWTPNGTGNGLWTDSDTSSQYTNQNITSVYARPYATQTYTLTATSGSCSSSQTVTVTANAASTAATGATATPATSCAGGNVTLTQTGGVLGTGATWRWYTDAGFTALAGSSTDANAALVVTPSANTTYYLRAEGGVGPCAGNVPGGSVAVTVNPAGTWLGVDNNWNNASNWCGGVPGLATNVTIPTAPNYPAITGITASANNISITGAGNITVGATGILQIAGAVSSTADNTIDVTAGTVEFAGANAQTLRANYFNSASIATLIISNTSVGGVTIDNTGTMLNITTEVNFGNNNNQKFNTNDLLTLKSTATATARIADVTLNGSRTGNDVLGKVVIERFIPSKRAWRLLTAPIRSTTLPVPNIFNQWQESAQSSPLGTLADPNPLFGTHVSKGIPALGSFDQNNTGNSSIFFLTASGWNGSPTTTNGTIAGTNTGVITDHPAYMLFVRGNRSTNLALGQSAPTSATTLRTTGNINVTSNAAAPLSIAGTGNYTVGAQTFNVWPNPYPSAISYHDLVTSTGNASVPDAFYLWDANVTGSNGVGGWVSLSWNGTNYDRTIVSGIGSSTIDNSGYIQSGSGFMVDYTGTINFREENKIAGSNISLFRPVAGQPNQVRANLNAKNSDGTISVNDGVLITFREEYNNGIDRADMVKMPTFAEYLGIAKDNRQLSIERRKFATMHDTICLQSSKLKTKDYQLEFTLDGVICEAGLTPVLEDNFLGTKTMLNVEGTTFYDFSVVANSPSANADRFRIVFKKLISYTHVGADVLNEDVAVAWNVSSEFNIKHYEIERSGNGTRFEPAGIELSTGDAEQGSRYAWLDRAPAPGVYYYRIKTVGNNGAIAYSDKVKVTVVKSSPAMFVFPNPVTNNIIGLQMNKMPAGVYETVLTAENGSVINRNRIVHVGGSATESITPRSALISGAYQLEVTGPDQKKTVLKVIVQTR